MLTELGIIKHMEATFSLEMSPHVKLVLQDWKDYEIVRI